MTDEKYCPACEGYHPFSSTSRVETYRVRGKDICVPVIVDVCGKCGQAVFDEQRDEGVMREVYAAYRRQESLLSPQEIKDIRDRYRLSQRSFAELLGMSEATINRYENGALQAQTHDNAIRACRDLEYVRGLLSRRGHLLSAWQRTRAEKALAGAANSVDDWLAASIFGGYDRMSHDVSQWTGHRRFDYSRYAAVVVWFCKRLRAIPQTKLNKLLFYSDFLNYKVATVSLTGSEYRKLQYGPVPAYYSELAGSLERDEYISVKEVDYGEGKAGLEYGPGPKAGQIRFDFSPAEQAVLEVVAKRFASASATTISRQSHQESAWRKTEEKKFVSYREATGLTLSLPKS